MEKQKISEINDFLIVKRLAIVGVSRNEKSFTRYTLNEMVKAGFDAIPVNPAAAEIENLKCCARLQDVDPAVDRALLMLKDDELMAALADCVEAGVKKVWIYGVKGPADVKPDAVEFCRDNDLYLVAGWCPHMFIKNGALFHKLHGFVWKVIGKYPVKG